MRRFVLAALIGFLALSVPGMALAAVDINAANEAQLESLPGIGPGKAKAIVVERQANGPFKSVDDLRRVKGIGDKTIAELRAQASVGSSPAAPAAPAATGAKPGTPPPAGGLPWGLIVLGVAAAGAIGWFVLRRRSLAPAPAPAAPPAREPPVSAPAPVVPTARPGPAPSGPAPRPAGPSQAGVAGKAVAGSASAPPVPAGHKPTGQPAPAAASAPPPAPAGPKGKDA